MAAEVLSFITVSPGDVERGQSAIDALDRARPSDRIELSIVHRNGTEERLRIPASMMTAIQELVRTLRVAGRVAVIAESDELTPEEAGKILGYSRPLVVRKMDAGKLPFHYVGAHRRCRLSDVLALKADEDFRQQQLRDLIEDSEDLSERPSP